MSTSSREPPSILFTPGHDDSTRTQHEYQQLVVTTGVHSAALGLWSESNSRLQARLDREMQTLALDVITGRKNLSDWDAGVASWRSGGGTKIAEEFAEAKQKQA